MLTIPVFLAVTAAYIVKGMCGFANTLVFGTLAGFVTDNVNISPVDLLFGLSLQSVDRLDGTERDPAKDLDPSEPPGDRWLHTRGILSEDRRRQEHKDPFSALWWYS